MSMQSETRQTVLLTGGAGYIGSHVAVALVQSGRYRVVIADNFSNSQPSAVDNVRKLVGDDALHGNGEHLVEFVHVDLDATVGGAALSLAPLRKVFEQQSVAAVIHLAAFKSVPESVEKPIEYYQNNLFSLLNILRMMDEFGVRRLIFSSSAAVYDASLTMMTTDGLDESAPVRPTNPYGQTKLMGEQICRDVAHQWATTEPIASKSDVNTSGVVCLRYGNPVNSHPSGMLPETPTGPAMNLFNVIMDVIHGRRSHVSIFGTDYGTPDGTGVRDFVHVQDVAEAHVATLDHLVGLRVTSNAAGANRIRGRPAFDVFNVGIGRGHSVREMIAGLEREHRCTVPTVVQGRRPGDVAALVFNVDKIYNTVGWLARRTTLEALCAARPVE